MSSKTGSTRTTPTHRCPVCARKMQLSGAFAVSFADGGSNYVLKYACDTCHVEMNRTEKKPLHLGRERGCQSERTGDRAA